MSGSFESVRWNARVNRLDLSLYSPQKEFSGNGVRARVNSKEKIPSTGGGSNPRRYITKDSEPNALPIELFWPANTHSRLQAVSFYLLLIKMLHAFRCAVGGSLGVESNQNNHQMAAEMNDSSSADNVKR